MDTAYEGSAETSTGTDAVWRRYVDVASWPTWNAAIEHVHLDGPFATGAAGTLTPPGGSPLPFRIVVAEAGIRYTSETKIADTVSLRTSSWLTALPGGGTRITQRSELVGPAAQYFAASFGPQLAAGVPHTVSELARVVEGE